MKTNKKTKNDKYIIINNKVKETIDANKIMKQSGLNKTIEKNMKDLKAFLDGIMKGVGFTIDTFSLTKYISEYIDAYKKITDEILNATKLLPKSRISGYDISVLEKYYWVIPFEYEMQKVKNLEIYKTKLNFEKYMIEYYSEEKTKRLFAKLKSQFKEYDKKELLKQIEDSFKQENYAICITSLMTLFDGATLILIHPSSYNQHKSHNAFETLIEIIENDQTNFDYELYLKTNVINNFIKKLYPKNYDLKKYRRKKNLIRDVNAHGVRYFNDRVNALRMLDALCYCNEIIKEINIKERLYSKKSNKNKFTLIEKS